MNYKSLFSEVGNFETRPTSYPVSVAGGIENRLLSFPSKVVIQCIINSKEHNPSWEPVAPPGLVLVVWRFCPFSGHGSPIFFLQPSLFLAVTFLFHTSGIPPNSNHQSISKLSNGLYSSEISSHYFFLEGGYENHPSLLCVQNTVLHSGGQKLRTFRKTVSITSALDPIISDFNPINFTHTRARARTHTHTHTHTHTVF